MNIANVEGIRLITYFFSSQKYASTTKSLLKNTSINLLYC